MCTADKLTSISNALMEQVAVNVVNAKEAMNTLEMMNITPRKYRKASESLANLTYANAYLARVLNVIATNDIKKTENIMRFHSHQLRQKGSIGKADGISKAQLEVADLFDNIINRFFED